MRARFMIAVAALASSVFAVPAVAQGPTVDEIDTAMLLRQEQIHFTTDQIWQRVRDEGTAGFTSIVQAEDASAFTVYWSGEAPSWLHGLVDDAEGPPGSVEQAPFSEKELVTAAQTTAAAAQQDHVEVSSVHAVPDGTGLIAQVANASFRDSASETSVADLEARLSDTSGVPVRVELTAAKIRPFTRGDDSPPWRAGGARNGPGPNCSISFAIRNSSWQVRILTAAHCGGGLGGTVKDGAGDTIGTLTGYDGPFDSAIIDPASTMAGYGRIFDGNWYTSNTIAVQGSTYNNINDYVCSSGQNSGTHCNLRVISITTTIRATAVSGRSLRTQPPARSPRQKGTAAARYTTRPPVEG